MLLFMIIIIVHKVNVLWKKLAFAMFVECTYTPPIQSEAKPVQIKTA